MQRTIVTFIHSLLIGSICVNTIQAVSPKPGLFNRKGCCLKTSASLPQVQPGIDEPEPLRSPVAGGRKIIVLLIEFTDNRADKVSRQPAAFQRLLFDSTGAVDTGSMYDYYQEVSYGRLFLQGHVSVWMEAPQTNAYYADDQFGSGRWPENSARLAYDAVAMADPYIDFSEYDGDGDGEVDGLFLIHAGPGGEETGDPQHLWSHKGTVPASASGSGRGYESDDGVKVSAYTMQPEEDEDGRLIGIGVFCHEYGHVLGLPDLYDRDNSSAGIGNWGLMGTGSWGGDGRSPETPVHLCAWSKERLGWVEPIVIDQNSTGVDIHRIEDHSQVFKLWTEGAPDREYFLVVNRQAVGFDSNLPSSGLLIWHIDNSVTTQNDDEHHKLVDLEAADGNGDMDQGRNRGDAGDAYPGTTGNRSFDVFSQPSSRRNDGLPSQVSVLTISDSRTTMQADFCIIDEQPILQLDDFTILDHHGNDDGKIDPGEDIECVVTVTNYGRDARRVNGYLHTPDPHIHFVKDRAAFSDIPFTSSGNNQEDPFCFSADPSSDVHYAWFTLRLWGDGDVDTSEGSFRLVIGHPCVLLVDDDEDDGDSEWMFDVEEYYCAALDSIGEVHDDWNRKSGGPPGDDLLKTYDLVVWFTGDADPPLSPQDIDHLTAFLNGGGGLFLSGQDVGSSLQHSPFLRNYLHAQFVADSSGEGFLTGTPADPISGAIPGLVVLSGANAANNQPSPDVIEPLDGATPVFKYAPSRRTAALKYEGTYRVVYLGFGFEALAGLVSSSEALRKDVLSNILGWLKGETTGIGTDDPSSILPGAISLAQNYPNPFNSTTTISYFIPVESERSKVQGRSSFNLKPSTLNLTLRVYNILGQEVRTLADECIEPGFHTATWNGRDGFGNEVASGVYFCRMEAGHFSQTKRMLLLK